MYGQNKVTGSFNESGEHLLVNEVFYTIQGEGPDAGRPAIFVRLSKCNLRCYFCDTEFETGDDISVQRLIDEVLYHAKANSCTLVVITGGEPLLQNIVPFVRHMNHYGLSCSVETAGTVCPPELHTVFDPMRSVSGNLIVCSPKTPKISPQIERLVGAWKYVIRADEVGNDGLPIRSTQQRGNMAPVFRPVHAVVPIWVNPMDVGDDAANAQNLRCVAAVAMNHGYRMGVQMHKLAGLR